MVVPADDRSTGNAYNSLDDLPKQLINQLSATLTIARPQKAGYDNRPWGDADEAKSVIHEAIERRGKICNPCNLYLT